MPLWQIDIYPADGFVDRDGQRTSQQISELGLGDAIDVDFARGYLVEGELEPVDVEQLGRALLGDSVTERAVVAAVGDELLAEPPGDNATLVHVLPKPGVMDPVAQSTIAAAQDAGWPVTAVRTLRKYWLPELPEEQLEVICRRALSNDSVEQVVQGPLQMDRLSVGGSYEFSLQRVNIRSLDDDGLMALSREGQLYLTLAEMQTIAQHFRELGREPTDIELETIAQTWSEHCSHKTLAGRIRLSRRARRAATFEQHAQGDDLRRHADDPRRRWATTTGASASSRTTPASCGSTTSSTSASRSKRTTTLRRSSPTAARTPGSAA